jgi:hypothetical protein
MILEYEKKQSITVENGCEHIVDGVIRFDDLIETKYKPTNFSAETKYYYLRDNHVDWDKMQQAQEQKIHKEWLEELGYDTSKYIVDFITHEIINQEELNYKKMVGGINDFHEDIESTESGTI